MVGSPGNLEVVGVAVDVVVIIGPLVATDEYRVHDWMLWDYPSPRLPVGLVVQCKHDNN